MDFIERWFNVSPDGGSGALEIAALAVGVLAAMVWTLLRGNAARTGASLGSGAQR